MAKLITDVVNDTLLISHILHWFLRALPRINEERLYKSLAKQPTCSLQNQTQDYQTLIQRSSEAGVPDTGPQYLEAGMSDTGP
jgi:hypothetical protein